jgi:hypothetical protein
MRKVEDKIFNFWAICLGGWWYVPTLDGKSYVRVEDPYTAVGLTMASEPLSNV